MDDKPTLGVYLRVLATFARNSLVRDMTFRSNFLINVFTSLAWVLMNLAFYVLIFEYTPMLGAGTGWGKYQFFLFYATVLLVNSLGQALFMTNTDDLSDLIRTGEMDFVLLKPIDPQFLVSLRRVEWSDLSNFALGLALAVYGLWHVEYMPGPVQLLLYPLYLLCGVAIYYSLMISLAVSSVWLGRNQSLYDFWFYITNFARYPMEIYDGPFGTPLRRAFTFVIPVLVAVNVPAGLLVRPLDPQNREQWLLPLYAIAATAVSLAASRWIFNQALASYRSASS